MTALAVLLALTAAPDDKPTEKAAPTKVTVVAETACLHCSFGIGDDCVLCLKIDDKTPLVLDGKAAKAFHEDRLEKKLIVVEGTLIQRKDKVFVLTCDTARVVTDKDKGKLPEKGQAWVAGALCCGKCDLELCDECTLAVKNGKHSIVLDGKLARDHAEENKGKKGTAWGKLFVDKRGLIRLDATKVETEKKEGK